MTGVIAPLALALFVNVQPGPFELSDGPRAFWRHVAVSPAYGQIGKQDLYALRVAYYPNSWFGYEASAGHSPGESVHALLHTLTAVARYPFAGRFQPYAAAGYGMIHVFPGESLNADPVTKNTLAYGGGLETFVRDDVALRFDLRGRTIFGRTPLEDEGAIYNYWEGTLGFSFYRALEK